LPLRANRSLSGTLAKKEKIMKAVQSVFAGLSALLTLTLLSVVAYLAFVFPKTVAVWQDEGRAISVLEQLCVNASHACSSLGIVLIPLLLLCFLAAVFWAIVAAKGNRANKGMHCTSL
jgi:type II secretory pathway component PulF